jgi:zinc protease
LPLNRFDPDYYPLQLWNHVLGRGFYATRLYHDLRQVAGYVYFVDVSLQASETRASYSVNYGCNPENVSKATQLIQRDLDQMRTENVSAAELHQAKALLLRQIPLSESSEAVTEVLLRRAEMGLPLDEPIRAAKRYFYLNADDVRSAFPGTSGRTILLRSFVAPHLNRVWRRPADLFNLVHEGYSLPVATPEGPRRCC